VNDDTFPCRRHSRIPKATDQPISLRAPFRGALLVAIDLPEFCYFYTHVVLKLPEHSRFITELEEDFYMNEEGGKDKC
jgi:hypothetical protein